MRRVRVSTPFFTFSVSAIPFVKLDLVSKSVITQWLFVKFGLKDVPLEVTQQRH
jgi:hypothetical protein